MPATLIKLIANNRTREFRPDNVDIIELVDESNLIEISLVSGSVIRLETPSPADARAKLAELDAAFGCTCTGVITITDENTGSFITTTTLEPTTTTTTCGPLPIFFNVDLGLNILDFTVTGSLFTEAVVKDPDAVVISSGSYTIYSVDADTFIYGIPFDSRYGEWTITIGACDYLVNVISATTTTSTTTTTTLEPTTTEAPTTTEEPTTTTTEEPTTTTTEDPGIE
jgi:hypothetical protein